jgi:hypothetical protein
MILGFIKHVWGKGGEGAERKRGHENTQTYILKFASGFGFLKKGKNTSLFFWPSLWTCRLFVSFKY